MPASASLRDDGQAVCAIILLMVLLYWSGLRRVASARVGGFESCDGDSPGPRLGTCLPDCSVSCRANYSARENFSPRGREKFSPDSIAYSAPGAPQPYTSACRRSAETPLARAARFETAALAAVNGGPPSNP